MGGATLKATSTGGGLYNNASMTVNAVTIAENTAAMMGGGIAIAGTSTGSVKNTISAMNDGTVSGADFAVIGGTMTSLGYNLIGEDDLSQFPAQSTDIEGTQASPVDPMLGPLQMNAGMTFTHALMTGSPAYNMGAPDDNFDDQIDQMVFGGRRDIGAFEAQTQLATDQFGQQIARSVVYPNPSSGGFINVMIASGFGPDVKASIVEVGSGRIVKTFTATENENRINVSGLSSGVYVLQLVSDRASENHSILIGN